MVQSEVLWRMSTREVSLQRSRVQQCSSSTTNNSTIEDERVCNLNIIIGAVCCFKGEIRCILCIFLGVYMLYVRALIGRTESGLAQCACVCVRESCHLIYSGRQACGRTSWGHTEGRPHRIFSPSFCGACLNFYRGKDSAVPFPRRP